MTASNPAGSSDEQALDEVLKRRPGAGRDWRLAKVCQVCGELATVTTWEEWCAAHTEGGEFKGFRDGHERCNLLADGGFAARAYRFCEICRATVSHVAERRLGLAWACPCCEVRVREAGHDPLLVLADLARLRFEAAERTAAGTAAGMLDPSGWPEGPRVAPPPDWLPPGLYPCPDCTLIRGRAWVAGFDGKLMQAKSTCLCEGITCRRCGDTRIHRPISDYYNLADGRFWHVPHFVGMFPCRECRAGRGEDE